MEAKLMDGTYYEIVGGFSEDIIININKTTMNDKKAKLEAINTERTAYKNTYINGRRVESVKLYDSYDDEYFQVGGDQLYYDPLSQNKAFEYSMLGRLKSDCDYFLGNGYGYEGHLWAGSVEKQIEEMKQRWNKFEEDEKPEWLTMEQIEKYEHNMLQARESRKKGENLMSKRTGDSLKAYTQGGYRERYAMDNGNKRKYIDGRGHEMWRFTYSKYNEYQDANGATWDNTEGRWVG